MLIKEVLIMHKKLLTGILLGTLAVAMLTGCHKKNTTTSQGNTSKQAVTTENTENTQEASSEEATTEEPTTAQATTEDNAGEHVDVVDENGNPIDDSEETTPSTASKDDESKVTSATGQFQGFGDGNSCEIEMEDGSTMVFLVEDEDLLNFLDGLDTPTKISFTYSPKEGQANNQILSAKVAE